MGGTQETKKKGFLLMPSLVCLWLNSQFRKARRGSPWQEGLLSVPEWHSLHKGRSHNHKTHLFETCPSARHLPSRKTVISHSSPQPSLRQYGPSEHFLGAKQRHQGATAGEHVCSVGSLSWPRASIHKGAPWPLSVLSYEGTEHFFPAVFDTYTLLITFSKI